MSAVINNSAPCKDCQTRCSGCHASCDVYSIWKQELKQKKEMLYGEHKRNKMLSDFYIDSCRKQIKRNGDKAKW